MITNNESEVVSMERTKALELALHWRMAEEYARTQYKSVCDEYNITDEQVKEYANTRKPE